MESNQNQHLELWAQFLAGEALSTEQRQTLLDALRNNQQFRAIALRDQELNWLLAELQTEAVPEADFVQGVMARCQDEDQVVNGQQESNSSQRKVARSSRFAVESPPVRQNSPNKQLRSKRVNGHEKPSPKPAARKRGRRISHQMVALACAFLFVLGIGALALIDFDGENATNANNGESNSDGSGQDTTEQGNTQDRPHRDLLEPVLTEFATLTDAEDAIWSQATEVGDRLGKDELQLLSGRAELTLDDGAVVNLNAPASFHLVSPAEVNLAEGNLSAVVPQHAIGFRVITPTSNIVDLGTEFDVDVEDSGATDVFVRRGEVAVTANDDAGQPEEMRLVADGLNQATVFERVVDRPESPVASAARGMGGQFHGTISVNGKSMQFDDPEAFENVRQRVFTGFRATPSRRDARMGRLC